jgi:hypothetical protein
LCKVAWSVSHKETKGLLIGRESKKQQSKLVWLAAMVVKAEQSAEGDANKLLLNYVKLNQAETEMMKRLQSMFPKLGRSGVFRLALRHFYLSKFK